MSLAVLLITTFFSAVLWGNADVLFDRTTIIPILHLSPFMFMILFGTGIISLLIATFLLRERTKVAERRKRKRLKQAILVLLVSSMLISIVYGIVRTYIGYGTKIDFLNLDIYRFFFMLGTGISSLLLGLFVSGD